MLTKNRDRFGWYFRWWWCLVLSDCHVGVLFVITLGREGHGRRRLRLICLCHFQSERVSRCWFENLEFFFEICSTSTTSASPATTASTFTLPAATSASSAAYAKKKKNQSLTKDTFLLFLLGIRWECPRHYLVSHVKRQQKLYKVYWKIFKGIKKFSGCWKTFLKFFQTRTILK